MIWRARIRRERGRRSDVFHPCAACSFQGDDDQSDRAEKKCCCSSNFGVHVVLLFARLQHGSMLDCRSFLALLKNCFGLRVVCSL